MFGILSDKESWELLDENIFGRIGCHAFGKTYVVPISYAHKDKKLYCHTYEGLKLQMMRNNPSVCFQVDQLDDMANWKSVIIQGIFKELEGEEKKNGLKTLLDRKVPALVSETVKLSPDWPFTTDEGLSQIPGVVFAIEVQEITGRYEKAEPVEHKK